MLLVVTLAVMKYMFQVMLLTLAIQRGRLVDGKP
jgi:hypothetical protein